VVSLELYLFEETFDGADSEKRPGWVSTPLLKLS